MYMIYILIVALAMIARKSPRKRAMGRYVQGNLDIDINLGTLTAKTAILGTTDTVIDKTLVSSVVATYSLSGVTSAQSDGPVEVEVAHSDYTLAQIEEYLELATSWNETNLIDKEVQSRKIRRIRMFDTPDLVGRAYTLNDGKAIKTKLNWIMTNGQGLNYWCYNLGTNAFATTDPNVNIRGHANL